MRARRIPRDRHVLQTNLLANAVMLLTGFLSLLFSVAVVIRRGSVALHYSRHCDWIIVPGHALEAGLPSADFRARLDRARELARHAGQARVLVLGAAGPGQTRSEAEVGQRYLAERGVAPERIVTEDTSRHTLENFQRALPLLREAGHGPLLLVTNRYHLARSLAMAHNLGLEVVPCPAEARWRPGPRLAWRVVWEGYLLHWYHIGLLYARVTGNVGMLARVSRRTGPD